MADRPLRPATDRRLGKLLPYQPANRTQAHPLAPRLREALLSHESLCGLVGDFSPVFLTTGQVTHVLLTRPPLPLAPKSTRSFDLHVLGTPPAFILSQDQTRHSYFQVHPFAERTYLHDEQSQPNLRLAVLLMCFN